MYDTVVIGGGPAGIAAAVEANKEGAKTLIIAVSYTHLTLPTN